MVDSKRKQSLLQSLDKMKGALPKFLSAMQTHVRSKTPMSKVSFRHLHQDTRYNPPLSASKGRDLCRDQPSTG